MRVSDEVVAAAIAAVEAFLEDERRESESATSTRGISAWRMALAERSAGLGFGANVSWRGRD